MTTLVSFSNVNYFEVNPLNQVASGPIPSGAGFNFHSVGAMVLNADPQIGDATSSPIIIRSANAAVMIQSSLSLQIRDSAGTLVTAIGTATGNVVFYKSGSTLSFSEAANKRQGLATLVAGTVTVTGVALTASTRIYITNQNGGTAPGALYVSNQTATTFTVKSTSATDDCQIAFLITNKV